MKNQKGFTLIEVLVAVSLLAIISVLLWQAMGSSSAGKERFEKKDETFRAGTLALNRISRDLEVAVLFVTPDFQGVSPSGELWFKSVFIGENKGDQDSLTFGSLSHVRYLKDVKESDLAEVSYFLEPQEDNPGFFVLKKRDQSPPDTETDQGGSVGTLLEGVKDLNFRYYDVGKDEFVDAWDTTKLDYVGRLPVAVEITLVIADPVDEGETLRFSTVVKLEMAPGPNDF